MSFLMWEYQGVDVGRFHSAATDSERKAMIAKGFQDVTGLQSLAVKYPTGKANIQPIEASPLDVAPTEKPVDAPVAKPKKTLFTKKKA